MRQKTYRIAVLTSSYPRFPGDGAAPFVKSICEGLAQLGHEIEVLAPHDIAVRPQPDEKVPVHRFRYIWPESLHIMGHARALEGDQRLNPLSFFLLPFFLTSGFITLMRLAGKQKAQIIYAHWVIPNGLIAALVAKIKRIPLIISPHGSDIFVGRSNPIYRTVTRWIFKQANGVTACSPDLYTSAIHLAAPANTILLPWGADPQRFTPTRRTTPRLLLTPAPGQKIIIAALGRLVEKKGFHFLIKAFAKIAHENSDASPILGGNGSQEVALRQLAEELGITSRVVFAGSIPWNCVPEFLANSDIFVLPSVRDKHGNVDGLPTVLLEAMSSQVATVASDIGGTSLVIDNQKNGLLVPAGDVTALAENLRFLMHDHKTREKIAIAGRQSIVENHNWNNVVKSLTDLMVSGEIHV